MNRVVEFLYCVNELLVLTLWGSVVCMLKCVKSDVLREN